MIKLIVSVVLLLVCVQFGAAYAAQDGLSELGYDDDETEDFVECEIFNAKYKRWFVHAERYAKEERRNVTMGRFTVFSDNKQQKWYLEPAEGYKNGFYLKNVKYGEKLYAESSFTGFNPFTQKRRKVYTWRRAELMQKDNKSFIWVLTKADKGKLDQYYIYNLGYREPLYAGSWAYKGVLYTWHKKHEDHDQFRWNLKCNKQPKVE